MTKASHPHSASGPISQESLLALARHDLPCYTLANFPAFELAPHLEIIAAKLEAVERGEVKRLILSLPPRHGKSLLASTYFVAWYIGRHPDRYVIAASYGQELADDFGRRVRNTLSSPLHTAIFPESRVSGDSAAMNRLNLTAGGAYFAVGRGAAITGRGAHLLLIDDPLKDAEEAGSPTTRRALQSWFSMVAYTRLMPGAAVVLIQTRWHEDDLAGWLLREHGEEGWEVLTLPAIAEKDEGFRREGEALWPSKYPIEVLQRYRLQIGGAAFASLYQQRPAAAEGAIFKREWFRTYTAKPERFSRIVLSLDTAFKTAEENDYSAATVWGEAKDGYYLLHAWKGRVEFPALKRVVALLAAEWKPHSILVEDKASGQSLIQELKRDTTFPVLAVKVDSDKISRAQAVTPLFEAGKVLFPDGAGWLADLVDELASFPKAQHDDLTDSVTQALSYLRNAGSDAYLDWLSGEIDRHMGAGTAARMSEQVEAEFAAIRAQIEAERQSQATPCQCARQHGIHATNCPQNLDFARCTCAARTRPAPGHYGGCAVVAVK
jgi:predicted phage terminase large subunit-like protein